MSMLALPDSNHRSVPVDIQKHGFTTSWVNPYYSSTMLDQEPRNEIKVSWENQKLNLGRYSWKITRDRRYSAWIPRRRQDADHNRKNRCCRCHGEEGSSQPSDLTVVQHCPNPPEIAHHVTTAVRPAANVSAAAAQDGTGNIVAWC